MPFRILVQNIYITSIVRPLSEQTSILSFTFFALSMILQQQDGFDSFSNFEIKSLGIITGHKFLVYRNTFFQ